jgi:hypothetical protein
MSEDLKHHRLHALPRRRRQLKGRPQLGMMAAVQRYSR